MRLLQQRANEKRADVIIPGIAMGNIIFVIVWNLVAPSTIADSSISLGMELKYPIKSQVEKGMAKVGNAITREKTLSARPKKLITSKRETKRRAGGTR